MSTNRNLWVLCLTGIVLLRNVIKCSPLYNYDSANIGPKLNIRNLPCVSSKTGETGICMFAVTCAKSNGTILGICLDRFYFGSCCKIPIPSETNSVWSVESNEIPTDGDKYEHKPLRPPGFVGINDIVKKLENITKQAENALSIQSTTEQYTTQLPHTTMVNKLEFGKVNSSTEAITEGASTPSPATISEFLPITSTISSTILNSEDDVIQSNSESSSDPTLSYSTTVISESTTSINSIPLDISQATQFNELTTMQQNYDSLNDVSTTFSPMTTTHPTTLSPLESSEINSTIDNYEVTEPNLIDETISTTESKLVSDNEIINTTTNDLSLMEFNTASTTVSPTIHAEDLSTTYQTTPIQIYTTETFVTETPIESTVPVNMITTEVTTQKTTHTSDSELTKANTTSSITTSTQTSTTANDNQFINVWQLTPVTYPSTTTLRPPTTTSLFGNIFNNFWNAIYSDYEDDENEIEEPVPESEYSSTTTTPTTTTTVATRPTSSPQRSTSLTTTNTVQTVMEATTIKITSTAAPVTEIMTEMPTTVPEILTTVASVSTSTNLAEEDIKILNMSNYKEVCGKRIFPESRIVGGVDSYFAKWPWQTSLMRWIRTRYFHKCGAALLTENWAITAAHCTYQIPPSELLLRFGQTDLTNEEEPYQYHESRVQLIASHNEFNPVTFEYDIAMLRLYNPIEPFRPNIVPVCLTDDDNDYEGTLAHVTGWGRLYDGGPLASILQDVQVPVISNDECMNMYKRAGYRDYIPNIFMCAAWSDGHYDSCEGDSGGPLVVQRDSDARWILIGVISWGRGCAEANKPGVYTRISEFREWINTILKY